MTRRARHGRVTAWTVLIVALVGCRSTPASFPPATRSPGASDPAAGPPTAASANSPRSTAAPPGWRLESSHGVQLTVPGHWAVNDYGCNMTQGPTVVRGQGAQAACLTPETPTKELAWIGPAEAAEARATAEFPVRTIALDELDVERAEGRASDGRHVGSLRLPSQGAFVLVKARDAATMRRILDSARSVKVDHNGCPDTRPSDARPAAKHPGAEAALAPANPRGISICYYGESSRALQSSARLVGEAASKFAAQMNSMPAGPNPDADPRTCLHPKLPPPPDAVLFVEDAARRAAIYVTFGGCVRRGLDNGARRAHVSAALIKAFMQPLHTGYGFNGDL